MGFVGDAKLEIQANLQPLERGNAVMQPQRLEVFQQWMAFKGSGTGLSHQRQQNVFTRQAKLPLVDALN